MNKRNSDWRILGRYLLAATLMLVLCAAIAYLAWQRRPPAPVPEKIDTVAAQTGEINPVIKASGKLTLFRYADVSAQIPGQIKDIDTTVGDMVKSGKLLVSITPVTDTARVENNRAQLARMNAELADQSAQAEFSQLQFQRQTRLKADEATRQEDVESSRTNMLSSAAKVEAIRAQIHQTEANIKEDDTNEQKTRVAAPMTGTIVSLAVHKGQILTGNQSALLRIADLSQMTVEARVAEKDVTRLQKGMMAYFSTAGFPGKRWSGKLNQIMPLPIDDSAQQGKQSFYTVLFDVPNKDHELMSGMNVEVEFILPKKENVVVLPLWVLPDIKSSSEAVVTVALPQNKFVKRKIVTGAVDNKYVQVIAGLQTGDRVVVNHGIRHDTQHPECPSIESTATRQ